MNVFRRRRPEVEHALCLTKPDPGPYEAECRALGINIYRVVWRCDPFGWSSAFYRLLKTRPVEVVHSHAHSFSGLVLLVAYLAGVRRRIAHAHTVRSNAAHRSVLRSSYEAAMMMAIEHAATVGLGISDLSAADLFGPSWHAKARVKRLLYGFDFSRFEQAENARLRGRALIGVEPSQLVVGHVGRFVPFKNHTFLLDLFAEVVRLEPGARLLLVGGGPLEPETRKKAESLGIESQVIFFGEADDVPTLMAAMDVFVLPSWTEGLGIVALEAQAAGLPLVLTDTIPHEVDLAGGNISRLSLDAEPSLWAHAARDLARKPKDRAESLRKVLSSPFNIDRCLDDLVDVYTCNHK